MAAATAMFFYRLRGTDDVIVGLPVAARSEAARRIPGMTSNVLPVRFAMHPGVSVSDVVKQASRRLEVIALLAAVVWIFATLLYHLIDLKNAGNPAWMSLQPSDALVGVGAAMSLGLYFYLRQVTLNPRWVLDLGLVFLVATAAIIGQILHLSPDMHASIEPMFSWIGILVLLVLVLIGVTLLLWLAPSN